MPTPAPAAAAPSDLVIRPLAGKPAECAALADLLVAVVAGGGSVSFMHPLDRDVALAFWDRSLAAAARGERRVLGAFVDAALAGTVTVHLDSPPNQPHRGEIAKLMTGVPWRGRGIARALMIRAEAEALAAGRSLLVLDTATDGGARGLYESLGWRLTGEIPDYALKPHGGLTGTLIYWKRIAA